MNERNLNSQVIFLISLVSQNIKYGARILWRWALDLGFKLEIKFDSKLSKYIIIKLAYLLYIREV